MFIVLVERESREKGFGKGWLEVLSLVRRVDLVFCDDAAPGAKATSDSFISSIKNLSIVFRVSFKQALCTGGSIMAITFLLLRTFGIGLGLMN